MNLVTGATGHIGNVLVRELLDQGEPVRCLILPQEDLTPLRGMNIEVCIGDITNLADVRQAMRGMDTVFHLAGVISILPGKDEKVRRVNVLGTHNILQAAAEMPLRRLVYTSSIHAIRRMPAGVTIDESTPFDPVHALSEYDRSKAEASLAVLQAVSAGLDAIIICPTGVIGPHDYRRSEMGQLILDCMRRPIQFCIQGAYDFVDVRDVARGLILARERGKSGETYILSGEQLSIARVIETIRNVTGRRFLRLDVPLVIARWLAWFTPFYYRLSGVKPQLTRYAIDTVTGNSVISHLKAFRELGYSPRSMVESIADTVRWFLDWQAFTRRGFSGQSFHK